MFNKDIMSIPKSVKEIYLSREYKGTTESSILEHVKIIKNTKVFEFEA